MTTNPPLIGLEHMNRMILKQDGAYVDIYMGRWISQLFTDYPSKVTNVDPDGIVQQIDLTDTTASFPEFKLWSADQMGLCYERVCTTVNRTDLTKLPANSFQILRFVTQNGSTFTCGPDTPFVTRVNNIVQYVPANQMPVGEMIACSLNSYIISSSPPVLDPQPVQDYMQVPHIITGTWGDVTLTRGEAFSGLQICENYPESVDPGDYAVFDEVLTEQVQYDPITSVTDITWEYLSKQQYLYWVDTDYHNFASFQTCFLTGEPVPGPVFKPLKIAQNQPGENKEETNQQHIQDNIAKFKADVEKFKI
jgi:hypothetical protein